MDYDHMTDEELTALHKAVEQELTRRQSLDGLYQEIGAAISKARVQGIIHTPEPGDEWSQPTGYHNAYMQGDIVTHNDKEWESLHNGNDQEPGVRGWREILEDNEDGTPQYPVWSQPQGYEEAYEPGALVWHPDENGDLYENVHTGGNSWEPGTPHSQWEPWISADDGEEENEGGDPA